MTEIKALQALEESILSEKIDAAFFIEAGCA